MLVVVNFSRAEMKCSGMFYSPDTNQNKIMVSSSLGGNKNSNFIGKHKTFA